MSNRPEDLNPHEEPEAEQLDGHGVSMDCCPWRNDPELADDINTSLRFINRSPFKYAFVIPTLRRFAGIEIPDSVHLSEGQIFTLGAYAKGTIFRFQADLLGDGILSETYIGILDQLKKPNGNYVDVLIYEEEEYLQGNVSGIRLLTTWRRSFTLGQTYHDKILDTSEGDEYVYRMNEVEVLMNGAKKRLRNPSRKGLFGLVQNPASG